MSKYALIQNGSIVRIDSKPHMQNPQEHGWLPLLDYPPELADPHYTIAERKPQSEWLIGEDAVSVQYTIRDKTEAELQAWRATLSLGPVQLRRGLRAMGKAAAVAAFVATLSAEMQEDWQVSTEYKRLDPDILAAQADLEATDEEMDQLFLVGRTLA